ncbi:hypothetical protein [Sphingomonas sp.]|jgi:hypothetical protein|uniref:hypothetical protein n=1 Tax=Sphingomonas sp. TaxID=28214 RepID=UPI0035655FFB
MKTFPQIDPPTDEGVRRTLHLVNEGGDLLPRDLVNQQITVGGQTYMARGVGTTKVIQTGELFDVYVLAPGARLVPLFGGPCNGEQAACFLGETIAVTVQGKRHHYRPIEFFGPVPNEPTKVNRYEVHMHEHIKPEASSPIDAFIAKHGLDPVEVVEIPAELMVTH